MARYATCECFACHQVVPKPEAYRITINRESGHSSGSYRISRRSTSYYTGRTYYRRQDVWLCAGCYPEYQRQQRIQSIVRSVSGLAICGVIAFFIFGGHSEQKATSSADTTGAETPVNQTASLVRFEDVRSQPVSPPGPSLTDITRTQNRLIELGYLQGPADRLWGPRSRQALLAFKISNGLAADDKLEPSVIERLLSANIVRGPLSNQKPVVTGGR
jgi:hypothetical protein